MGTFATRARMIEPVGTTYTQMSVSLPALTTGGSTPTSCADPTAAGSWVLGPCGRDRRLNRR
ncbi:MAG: hypothetical protein ACREVR_19855 [Burkholderiales bacterium]